jgi:hypothetical protein
LNFSVDEIECCVERISFVLYFIDHPLSLIKTGLEGSDESESAESEENNGPSDEENNESSDDNAPKSCCQCTLS